MLLQQFYGVRDAQQGANVRSEITALRQAPAWRGQMSPTQMLSERR
jgi:hypothetical protein